MAPMERTRNRESLETAETEEIARGTAATGREVVVTAAARGSPRVAGEVGVANANDPGAVSAGGVAIEEMVVVEATEADTVAVDAVTAARDETNGDPDPDLVIDEDVEEVRTVVLPQDVGA